MSIPPDSTGRWDVVFSSASLALERARKQGSIINATQEAYALLDRCQIQRDEASVKVIVDHIVVLAAAKGVPVEIGE